MFQSTVTNTQLAHGNVGELAFDGPKRATSYALDSADAANNVPGRVFTIKSEGVAEAGGAGAFAGILINNKALPVAGLPDGSAEASYANGIQGEMLEMGKIFVKSTGDIALGAAVKYTTATGVIGFGAPGAGEAAVPNAKVSHYDPAGVGLAVITLTN